MAIVGLTAGDDVVGNSYLGGEVAHEERLER